MIENQTFERKREYNQNAKNTMLSFLNTDGGTLYIGVDDNGSVCGIEGNIDLETRRVTTAFRDSVTPDPSGYFKVETEKRDGKYIIIVTVDRGSAIPYCYAAYGLVPQGVYVRVGSTTVTATREHIRQMIKDNGTGQFFAELSIEQNLTFEYADKIFADREVKFEKEQKQSLGLIRLDGRYSNLALILSDQCPYSTKVAIFEGLNKEKFKDRKEFTGSLFKQIDETTAYLHVYNRVRGTFEGVYRIDHPDYPDIAIREAFINALIHRDYYIEGSVLVSMFDNRLEFMSLGGIMPGVTRDLMLAGVSVSRNEKLAQIFNRLNIIEAFGTGIPRIYGAYESCDAQPEIPITDGGFLIRIPNMNYKIQHGETNIKTVETSEQRLLTIFSDTAFNKVDAANTLGLTVSGAYKLLQRMVKDGLLIARKDGKQWIYSGVSSKARVLETSDRLDGKIVAFVGIFDSGSIKLKHLVFAAGGAPSDTVLPFTDYLVIGRNGKQVKIYKDVLSMIESGGIIELTENELRDICTGKIPAPTPEQKNYPDVVVVIPTSEEYEKQSETLRREVFETKRAAFIKRYGVLQSDGTRNKH
ncbi:MAG: putative DNA binding domain-containing protein [Christensenellaceae bacterium]|jgi:ATP-dependent DNA helicase RecG|nr:putative DNA binding domain-containing protein [Christensenellaceae bacterium]